MERPEVFYTYEWAKAVQRAYGASLRPFLVLAYESQALVGVSSLATTPKEKDICFLAATTADYCDFVCSSDDRTAFTGAVLAELRRLNMPNLVLANLPADSATHQALRANSSNLGYRLFSRPAYRCAQVLLHSREQREEVTRLISRKQTTRSYFKAIGKMGTVSLDHSKSGSEIVTLLPDFDRAHIARCLQAGRLSNLVSPERRLFLLELAGLLSERGWLTFSRLFVGDRAVAWNYGFHFAGSWFWYQPTFDFRWKQHSPGFCLLTKIVEEACRDEEVKVVDLGLGEEDYKDRLATASRTTLHVTVTQQLSRWAYEVIRYRSTAQIKARPRLDTLLRANRDRLARVRKRILTPRLPGLGRLLWSQAKAAVVGQPEVFFFEWPEDQIHRQGECATGSLKIQELDLEILAKAAMHYHADEETLDYLLRAAQRLRTSGSKGFALTAAEGAPLHFCWATEFEGFLMPALRLKLSAPSLRSILLFDCWTPISLRGRGYYGEAISRAAYLLHASGKIPWIFSSAANVRSLHGIKKTSFEPRFSLTRRRIWRSPIRTTVPAAPYSQPVRGSSAA